MMNDGLKRWVSSLKYLPDFMRDFHDQKDLFKYIQKQYKIGDNSQPSTPNWTEAQVYTIDCFLWFMALRGYTLQKCRKKVEFLPMPDFNEVRKADAAMLVELIERGTGGESE